LLPSTWFSGILDLIIIVCVRNVPHRFDFDVLACAIPCIRYGQSGTQDSVPESGTEEPDPALSGTAPEYRYAAIDGDYPEPCGIDALEVEGPARDVLSARLEELGESRGDFPTITVRCSFVF
jgi:hypothetical protein